MQVYNDKMILPEHLGGHMNITHIDQGILKYFKSKDASSYLDIGCGPGGMLDEAYKLGYLVQGIDGDNTVKRNLPDNVVIHDFTTGTYNFDTTYDLVWSCEFVEHVEERYIDNFMKVFQQGKTVCMTYAPIGKKGHHHVNCNTKEYWIEVFQRYGFTFNQKLTNEVRSNSTMKREFFRKYGLVFEHESINN